MKIWFLNTLGSGTDVIKIVSSKIPAAGVIGLGQRDASDSISDYIFQKDFCESQKLEFVDVENYALKSEQDKQKILSLDIDVLVVCGWQRLIPQWLIDHCKVCAIGSHGSPFGITGGRGRSPQNWSLILGLKKFYISIFKISAGIDDGDIIATKEFEYSEMDDIQTSYYKVVLLTSQMITHSISSGLLESQKLESQDDHEAAYFPQRQPEDGFIDWRFSSQDIHRMVRALTSPYPGARTKLNGIEMTVWEAIPFYLENSIFEAGPGEIVFISHSQHLLVKTKDGYLLIKKFSMSSPIELKIGNKFESIDGISQIKKIISRHENLYPSMKVVPALVNYHQNLLEK